MTELFEYGGLEKLSPPDGATHEIVGVFYKYGIHGKVFRWSSQYNEWVKSERKELRWSHSLSNPIRQSWSNVGE